MEVLSPTRNVSSKRRIYEPDAGGWTWLLGAWRRPELLAPSAVVPRAVHASITKPVIKTLIKGGTIGCTAGRDPVAGIGDFVSASVDEVRAEMQASAHEKQP